jgi:hypothetical protein
MRLQSRLVRRAEIPPAQRDAMFGLMDRHYENVRRDAFEDDLDEKDWVIQVHDPATGALCGFSTQMLLHTPCAGRPVTALFSGDTVIAREHWGDSALARAWGRLALRLMDDYPDRELYWFLLSKGYKTFRFLPVFFHDFAPHPDRPTPTDRRRVIDALARRKYPDDYDSTTCVVRTREGRDRLRPGLADVTPERLRDPFVRFFVQRNPGHAQGDELCCLAPLTRENFTPAAHRVIGAPAELQV